MDSPPYHTHRDACMTHVGRDLDRHAIHLGDAYACAELASHQGDFVYRAHSLVVSRSAFNFKHGDDNVLRGEIQAATYNFSGRRGQERPEIEIIFDPANGQVICRLDGRIITTYKLLDCRTAQSLKETATEDDKPIVLLDEPYTPFSLRPYREKDFWDSTEYCITRDTAIAFHRFVARLIGVSDNGSTAIRPRRFLDDYALELQGSIPRTCLPTPGATTRYFTFDGTRQFPFTFSIPRPVTIQAVAMKYDFVRPASAKGLFDLLPDEILLMIYDELDIKLPTAKEQEALECGFEHPYSLVKVTLKAPFDKWEADLSIFKERSDFLSLALTSRAMYEERKGVLNYWRQVNVIWISLGERSTRVQTFSNNFEPLTTRFSSPEKLTADHRLLIPDFDRMHKFIRAGRFAEYSEPQYRTALPKLPVSLCGKHVFLDITQSSLTICQLVAAIARALDYGLGIDDLVISLPPMGNLQDVLDMFYEDREPIWQQIWFERVLCRCRIRFLADDETGKHLRVLDTFEDMRQAHIARFDDATLQAMHDAIDENQTLGNWVPTQQVPSTREFGGPRGNIFDMPRRRF